MLDERGTPIRPNRLEVQQILKLYPETQYYLEETGFAKVFSENSLASQILKLSSSDELAFHLVCSPTFLAVPKNKAMHPGEFSVYIRVFRKEVSLTTREKELYKTYFPTERFLILAPAIPAAAWLSDYLKTGKLRTK